MFYLHRFDTVTVPRRFPKANLPWLCKAAMAAFWIAALSGGDVYGKTLGFVLSNSYVSARFQDDKLECPDGFRSDNWQNWEAQFPTEAARKRHMARCANAQNRGPNCENVWNDPEVIKDPLPFRESRSTVADGVDLDGVGSGVATAQTCPHQDFTSPDGRPNIDNQYYRFTGCMRTFRARFDPTALRKEFISQATIDSRLLMEITGVDDEKDDPAVEVAMYRGRDALLTDDDLNVTPWQSQRIDEVEPNLMFRVPGKIVAGELITQPADVLWHGAYFGRQLLIRAMSLHLRLTPTGAQGMRVGYIDAKQFWNRYASFYIGQDGPASGPSDYAALFRLADGYKDPRTGSCTALSSANQLEFTRANVIHPHRAGTS